MSAPAPGLRYPQPIVFQFTPKMDFDMHRSFHSLNRESELTDTMDDDASISIYRTGPSSSLANPVLSTPSSQSTAP